MKVLIAVDEKCVAEDLLEFVSKHKWKAGCEFIVVHAVDNLMPGSYMTVLPPDLLKEIEKENWSQAENLVRKIALALRDRLHLPSISELIISGNPGPSIVNTAREKNADLVIVGCHNRRGFERFIMGSVSSYVCSHAPCSVLVIYPKLAKSKESDTKLLASSNT